MTDGERPIDGLRPVAEPRKRAAEASKWSPSEGLVRRSSDDEPGYGVQQFILQGRSHP